MYAKINPLTSIAFTRRLLCRLPSNAPRTSYCRSISQAKNLIEDVKASSPPLSYKDYVLEPSRLPQGEFNKRFRACRSVDEVLHLAFANEQVRPQDLVGSVDALVRIQYRILSTFQWAYYDDNIAMRVQSGVNSEALDMFLSLHHHQSFVGLLNEVDKHMDAFSTDEAVRLLDGFLKLCVSRNHDVLVKLQQRCITECHSLDLAGLATLSEASNFLRRNGFVFNALVCSLLQQMFGEVPFAVESYSNLAKTLCHVAYFLSREYLDSVLEKSAAMLAAFRDSVSPADSLIYLEAGVRFSSGNRQVLQPFLDHLVHNCAGLSVNDLSKAMRLVRLGRLEDSSVADKVRERAMLRRSDGLLRTTDVVSLIGIFDMVGWTEDLRQEFSGLLAIHMSDVDALLIKHLASSRFLRECRSRDLMNLFAKRWMEKFSDVVATVSVFNAVVQLYNKTVMIPRQAREFLQKHLVEELRLGQLALNPERAMTCSSFLLRFGNTRSKEFALEIVERMKPQLSPLDFAQFLQSQRFDDEFSREHNLPHAWYNCIVEKRQEISGLHTAAYLLSKFFPPGTSIAPANAQLWADVFEESAPVLSPATFWHVLRCISGHRLYVPATLEVLCESALRQRLKVQLAMKLVEACVQVDFRSQCFEELGSLYANHLVEMEETDQLPASDVLHFAHSLLHLDCFAERLVRKIFSLGFLQKLDAAAEESPEEKDDIDRMLFECNRCVELQCPELDVPWLWSAPPSSLTNEDPQHEKFFDMVGDILKDLAGADGLVRPRTQSPYFHHIDFECYAGREFGFISQHDFKANPCLPVRRLAVVLLGAGDFCSNENHLIGTTATNLRQLEMLGYTVVQVPHNEFSSVGMDFEAQREYLLQKIFSP